jgi:O-antigen/teichoic acid export membrane protein
MEAEFVAPREAMSAGTGVTRQSARLTSGHRLARNTIWNLVGNGAPMLVAIFCIPVLIRGLGADRFGLLTLTWTVIGYASVFDLGLGRALTQLVARKLGAGEDDEVPKLVWTSQLLMLLLGLMGTVVVILIAPWLTDRVLHVGVLLQSETLRTFYLLGISIPVVTSTAGLRGLLEAQQCFDLVNALRFPMGAFMFVGPMLILPFSRSLLPIVAVLVVGRIIAWVAHLLLCLRVVPMLRERVAWHRAAVGPLLRFGGWMTVTNVVGPVMVTMDRFLIGAMLSVTAVAYYTTPYEMVTRLWLIPGAMVGVMFPAFSTSFEQDRDRTRRLYTRSLKYLALVLFPLVLLVVVFARNGLKLWLGASFAQNSFHVLQWLAAGVLVNSLANVPFAMLQGLGRPDVTAKLHMIELPVYMVALWGLTKTFGIEGTAIAWTARATVDALMLFILANRFLPTSGGFRPRTFVLAALALVTLASGTLPQRLMLKSIFVVSAFLGFLLTAWFLVLSREERNFAQKYF